MSPVYQQPEQLNILIANQEIPLEKYSVIKEYSSEKNGAVFTFRIIGESHYISVACEHFELHELLACVQTPAGFEGCSRLLGDKTEFRYVNQEQKYSFSLQRIEGVCDNNEPHVDSDHAITWKFQDPLQQDNELQTTISWNYDESKYTFTWHTLHTYHTHSGLVTIVTKSSITLQS
ncbi:MAG: DUF2617 family protein [Candidatus Dojkabacteria bacterium]